LRQTNSANKKSPNKGRDSISSNRSKSNKKGNGIRPSESSILKAPHGSILEEEEDEALGATGGFSSL
jgi:hypothetical protein